MVDGQVRPSDVTDTRIIDAMLAVPREVFVPPIPFARWPIWTSTLMSAKPVSPKRFYQAGGHGKMLQAADIKEGDNVLVVGAATGMRRGGGGQARLPGDGDRRRSDAGGDATGIMGPAWAGKL